MAAAKISGAGIGLRLPHAHEVLAQPDCVAPWFELLVDNWLVEGGLNLRMLDAIAERYPLVLHGVGLSLGGAKPIDFDYLRAIKSLKQRSGAVWYSEHACFCSDGSVQVPDLLPMPYTQEAVSYMAARIKQVQDVLGERILLENVSTYLAYPDNEMSEGQFLSALAGEADCELLLDINNAYVTCQNLDQSLPQLLSDIDPDRVKQIHLAGFEDKGDYLLDAHNHPVAEPVWQAFSAYIHQHGVVPSMIEWDSDLPSLSRLLQERQQVEDLMQTTQHRVAG
ncbi:DUF692 domain-containing protein [Shewanella sp. Scap07]|uniref:MNIO family bufferin maturase n=1 Tax=Shewanella sp. Scap07 TaxID=2589987 RepID=UPI0015BBDE6C|nr:DUF692 domain-containing protein [Shewanella sp. Scap07]QLE83790.1 DUF692 domain-containing protein [Shewanella sp. Scap07]